MGKTRIAFAGMTDIPELSARYAGYRDAHAAAGIAPGPSIPTPLAVDPVSQALVADLAAQPDIDAVVAASDMIAMAAIRALTTLGRRVPDDVAVVGYDDVTLAAHMMRSLTTIRQDLKIAAETILDLLFDRMAGNDTESVRIPLSLVARQSA